MLGLVGVAAAYSSAQSFIDPQAISTFDGSSWSGLTLKRDTDSDIKKLFKTERGAVRPEALKFVADKGAVVRVDALLDGRGGKAVMRAIRVEYLGKEPSVMDMTDAFDEQPQAYYQTDRTEDWHLEAFPDHGVIAAVFGSGTGKNVICYILTSPERVGVVTRQFSSKETRVQPPHDPGEDWNRIVNLGSVYADIDLDNSRPEYMNGRWKDDLKESLLDEARNYRGRAIRGGGNNGMLNIRLTADRFRDDSAQFRIALSLSGKTPYGDISKFANQSLTIERSHRSRSVTLLRDALDDLDSDVMRQLKSFGPEPIEAARGRAMQEIYKLASAS
ncbi:hypothetical protein BH11ARM1_BH11ARM1_14520 [soil metagenome]